LVERDLGDLDDDRSLRSEGTAPAPARPGLRFTIRRAGAAVIVAVHGQLEAAAAAGLDHVLRDLICDQGNRHVAVDLAGVADNDTNGVAALIDARRLAGGHGVTLLLLNTPSAIERALERCRDDNLLTDEGLGALCSSSTAGPSGGPQRQATSVPGAAGRPGLQASVGAAPNGQTGADDHVVELYVSEEHLAESVCDFLVPAARDGRAALVVATADHRRRFDDELRAAGVDVDRWRRCGQYGLLDASETLAAFMVDGLPDGPRFESAAAGLVRGMAADFGGIRIYGEMVAVLWADGNVGAALALEDLWNQLRVKDTFELLCAYPTSLFESDDAMEPFRRLCDQHTRVVPTETASAEEGRRARHRTARTAG
jgi:anti-anti-sigma factor